MRGGYETNTAAGLREVVAICTAGDAHPGARGHVSHLHVDAHDAERLLAEAAASGADLSFDMYPYTRGCTLVSMALLPPEYSALDVDDAIARLADAARLDAGTAIIDAGKRDFPYDEGLPVPLYALDAAGERMPLPGAAMTKLSDQHGFVRVVSDSPLAPGDLVVFGLSHPCTMLDKWRLVPVVDSVDDFAAAVVTDLVETRF